MCPDGRLGALREALARRVEYLRFLQGILLTIPLMAYCAWDNPRVYRDKIHAMTPAARAFLSRAMRQLHTGALLLTLGVFFPATRYAPLVPVFVLCLLFAGLLDIAMKAAR